MLLKSGEAQFILDGFTQERECRVFAFVRVGADRSRTDFIVRADLSLARRYGIQIQELPLLSRHILDKRGNLELSHSLIFTEAEMSKNATDCAAVRAAAAQKKKPWRRPPSENVGLAWRGQQPE